MDYRAGILEIVYHETTRATPMLRSTEKRFDKTFFTPTEGEVWRDEQDINGVFWQGKRKGHVLQEIAITVQSGHSAAECTKCKGQGKLDVSRVMAVL